jgi:hypothetical protein
LVYIEKLEWRKETVHKSDRNKLGAVFPQLKSRHRLYLC